MPRPLIIRSYADLGTAADRLCTDDLALAHVRASLGTAKIPLRRMPQGFESLLKLIVYQQISLTAAGAIWARLAAEGANAHRIARLGEVRLKALGLSAPKARYAAGIAERVASGKFAFDRLARQGDEEARGALLGLPGIGPWSAELYLLQALLRADAFPAGDLALQEAARGAFGLAKRPDAQTLEGLAERWRPYRSVAARLLWTHYRAMKAPSPSALRRLHGGRYKGAAGREKQLGAKTS